MNKLENVYGLLPDFSWNDGPLKLRLISDELVAFSIATLFGGEKNEML